MEYTSKYNLKKPQPADPYDVEDFNDNAELVEATLAALDAAVSALSASTDEALGQVGDSLSGLQQALMQGLAGAVPTTRKVNGKALSSDISLDAADVGARPNTWTPTAADVGAAPSGHTHSASDVGALAANGTAAAATKLATARTIRTNLGSTAAVSFDGTDNVTPGVTGTLPLANGGTGVTTIDVLKTALGITRIQTGSYTGTGTYGQNNPCSLTFNFIPKLIVIYCGHGSNSNMGYLVNPATYYAFVVPGSAGNRGPITWGNTVSWYTLGGSSFHQMNEQNMNYSYFAIG